MADIGKEEGHVTGPRPGEGASSVGGMVAGGSDIEGTPPDTLPSQPRRTREEPGIATAEEPYSWDRGQTTIGPMSESGSRPSIWLILAASATILLLVALWLFGAFGT